MAQPTMSHWGGARHHSWRQRTHCWWGSPSGEHTAPAALALKVAKPGEHCPIPPRSVPSRPILSHPAPRPTPGKAPVWSWDPSFTQRSNPKSTGWAESTTPRHSIAEQDRRPCRRDSRTAPQRGVIAPKVNRAPFELGRGCQSLAKEMAMCTVPVSTWQSKA